MKIEVALARNLNIFIEKTLCILVYYRVILNRWKLRLKKILHMRGPEQHGIKQRLYVLHGR